MTDTDLKQDGRYEMDPPPQDFLDGYALGFSAAKHPFHMPAVDEAWRCRADMRERGHLPPLDTNALVA